MQWSVIATLVVLGGTAVADEDPHPNLDAPIALPDLWAPPAVSASLLASRVDASNYDAEFSTNQVLLDVAATRSWPIGGGHLAITGGLPVMWAGPEHDPSNEATPAEKVTIGNLRFGVVASLRRDRLVLGAGVDGYIGIASDHTGGMAQLVYADPARTFFEASVARLHFDTRIETSVVSVQFELAAEGWRSEGRGDIGVLVRAAASLAYHLRWDSALIVDASSYVGHHPDYVDSGRLPAAALSLDTGWRLVRGPRALTFRASVPVAPGPYLVLGADFSVAL